MGEWVEYIPEKSNLCRVVKGEKMRLIDADSLMEELDTVKPTTTIEAVAMRYANYKFCPWCGAEMNDGSEDGEIYKC